MSQPPTDVVTLTVDLCRIPSLLGQEEGVCAHLINLCRELGLLVTTQDVGTPGRCNVLAMDPQVPPQVLFTTHVDTVPPFTAPQQEGDRLTGRGTCDAKGAAAAMVCAVQALRAAGETRVGLLFLVGEEGTSDGAKAAALGFVPTVQYFVNGEPTGNKLTSAQKGTLSFRLHARGVPGHSAYPELGRSAVHSLVHTLAAVIGEAWPGSPELGETTVNVGMVEGGVASNVLAPQANAQGIFRLAVPVATVQKQLEALLPHDVTLEVMGGTDPVVFHVPDGMSGDVVRFGSDVPYLAGIGTPLMVGPGSVHDAHTDHEFVLKADLHAAVDLYQDLARRLLG